MQFNRFSRKQLAAMSWWMPQSPCAARDAIICDGAVRSGKTLCLGLGFVLWASASFCGSSFAFCGKTAKSLRRNLMSTLIPALKSAGFGVRENLSEGVVEIARAGVSNRFFLFGGRDEGSAALIQGVTLAGVLFDEAALMPQSFIEQAVARCSVEGSRFWFNCNPEHPQHWFYREWILGRRQKNALYLHFTMEDNPSLSAAMRRRYRALYTGTFYERYIEGKWVAAQGLIYPFMERALYCAPPAGCQEYRVSCDYGTVNPASFGLWGLSGGVWYRVDEYYYDARAEGESRTDEEHYAGLQALCAGKRITAVAVDPSAASFLETIRSHGEFPAVPAVNDVVDGIRRVSVALKQQRIRICACCADTIREFGLYRWKDAAGRDVPVKEHDHAMDDIRYFVCTLLEDGVPFLAVSLPRRAW